MSDFYTEQLIKKRTGTKELFIKALLVAVAIASVFSVFIIPMGIIIPVIFVALAWFLITRMDVEYEYLYVNGDLDIDKIMHKSKRKRVFSVSVDEIELLAPADSARIGQFRNTTTLDLSSGSADARKYVLVAAKNGQMTKLVFEPNDTIVEGMFMLAPRKVVRS